MPGVPPRSYESLYESRLEAKRASIPPSAAIAFSCARRLSRLVSA